MITELNIAKANKILFLEINIVPLEIKKLIWTTVNPKAATEFILILCAI